MNFKKLLQIKNQWIPQKYEGRDNRNTVLHIFDLCSLLQNTNIRKSLWPPQKEIKHKMFIFLEYHLVYCHILYPNKIIACICLTLHTLLSEIYLCKTVVEKANPSAKMKIGKV